MSTLTDPLSLVSQLLREIRPSKAEESKQREREREQKRRKSAAYRRKNRIRMQQARRSIHSNTGG